MVAFGQANQIESNVLGTVILQDIETKKIHVGDIDIAYKEFGKGDPILLISGFSGPLDFWDPILLGKLASNHTVITFDNRGIGNTTSGDKIFSIKQFANDTDRGNETVTYSSSSNNENRSNFKTQNLISNYNQAESKCLRRHNWSPLDLDSWYRG